MGLGPLLTAADGFQVTPQLKLVDDDDNESTIPNFIIEVSRATEPGGLHLQVVLIVKVKNYQHWPEGVARLFVQLCRQANSAFAQIARGKLYWIAVIGPHWRYGTKEDDGQLELSPLTTLLMMTLLSMICRRSQDWSVHFRYVTLISTLGNVLNSLQSLIGTLPTYSLIRRNLHQTCSESLEAPHCLIIQILSTCITILFVA